MNDLNRMAASATLHCLLGCSIGEVLGLITGVTAGIQSWHTIIISIILAFIFGYTLSALPLLRHGMPASQAFKLVLAADTLSILTMEIVDNATMMVVPGAMNKGITHPIFWFSMVLALSLAFAAAYPVNHALLKRGKGHALTHEHHHM